MFFDPDPWSSLMERGLRGRSGGGVLRSGSSGFSHGTRAQGEERRWCSSIRILGVLSWNAGSGGGAAVVFFDPD
ncbi:hypothetical protein ABT061_39505, partial [Streptosporangium sp. NPDC002544]|uniref:hypothetical protein n=1 Tax=Streptosporangium sp. NPDC002544 TaxID=3154538 RepID=UPI00332181EC